MPYSSTRARNFLMSSGVAGGALVSAPPKPRLWQYSIISNGRFSPRAARIRLLNAVGAPPMRGEREVSALSKPGTAQAAAAIICRLVVMVILSLRGDFGSLSTGFYQLGQ